MYDNVTIECIPETMGKGITWVIMKGKLLAKIRGPRVWTLKQKFWCGFNTASVDSDRGGQEVGIGLLEIYNLNY